MFTHLCGVGTRFDWHEVIVQVVQHDWSPKLESLCFTWQTWLYVQCLALSHHTQEPASCWWNTWNINVSHEFQMIRLVFCFFLYIFLILYWYKNCPIYYLFWCIHFGSCIRSIWNIWYWRRVVSPISDTVEPHWNHCRYLIHLLFCWPLSNCSGLVSCSCISHVFLYPEINPVTVISLHEIPMFNHPVKHVNKQSSHSDGRIIYTWNHLDKDLGFPLPDSHICCVH